MDYRFLQLSSLPPSTLWFMTHCWTRCHTLLINILTGNNLSCCFLSLYPHLQSLFVCGPICLSIQWELEYKYLHVIKIDEPSRLRVHIFVQWPQRYLSQGRILAIVQVYQNIFCMQNHVHSNTVPILRNDTILCRAQQTLDDIQHHSVNCHCHHSSQSIGGCVDTICFGWHQKKKTCLQPYGWKDLQEGRNSRLL